jgi:hypothetical protein
MLSVLCNQDFELLNCRADAEDTVAWDCDRQIYINAVRLQRTSKGINAFTATAICIFQ